MTRFTLPRNIFVHQVLNEEQHHKAALNEYNFDHPDAFDMELLCETLRRLRDGKKVEVPVYNFVTHGREAKTVQFVMTVNCNLYLYQIYFNNSSYVMFV